MSKFNLTAFLTSKEEFAQKTSAAIAERDAAQASLATVTAERDAATAKLAAVPTGDATLLAAAQADLATAKASLTSTTAACDEKITAICGALGIPVADAADSAKIQSALAAKVAARSTSQLAELGFDAAQLPSPIPANAETSKNKNLTGLARTRAAFEQDIANKTGSN